LKKYTLIISEKPDAANRIASALDDKGKTMRETDSGVPFFAAKNGDKDIIVASALGHLYTVAGTKKGEWDYPFSIINGTALDGRKGRLKNSHLAKSPFQTSRKC
jgi:DNA topoisomerase-1